MFCVIINEINIFLLLKYLFNEIKINNRILSNEITIYFI